MTFLINRGAHALRLALTAKKHTTLPLTVVRFFHIKNNCLYRKAKQNNTVAIYPFQLAEQKEKENFLDIIRVYERENVSDVGYAQFILTALKYMDEFGVNKDIEVYKKLVDILPKGKYIPTNVYQQATYFYPKQQDTIITLLSKMEDNKVIPDSEMENMLLNIFGKHSTVLKKCWRMLYWMPKFANLNPWPVPMTKLLEPQELAEYAIKKISSSDVQTKITEYRTKDIEDSIDDTWIISAMSISQQDLLAAQPTDQSLFIEGPYTIWFGNNMVDYFVLKGNPIKRDTIYIDNDDISNLKLPFWEVKDAIPLTVHEQDDGVYYAMCATGVSSKDSLLSWIRCLQKTNPILEKIPIVFKLKSRTKQQTYIDDKTIKAIADEDSQCEIMSEEKQ